jgi:hypothetical protein
MNPFKLYHVRRVRRSLLPPEPIRDAQAKPVTVATPSEQPTTETKATEPAEAGTANTNDAQTATTGDAGATA